jgi:D-alanyl-D-alanine carboxypeptidase
LAIVSVALLGALSMAGTSAAAEGGGLTADTALDRALARLVALPGGPPGVIAIVQRGDRAVTHRAGVADVTTGRPPTADDAMRIASTAKAFSGAVALSLVSRGRLSLDDTIGRLLDDMPRAWQRVTLRQLLNHTSGMPDFTQSPAFGKAFLASPDVPPPPARLLSYVKDQPLRFPPGSQYHYSNSDNIVVGLMVQAATGSSYEDQLAARVSRPAGLVQTSLPRGAAVPSPAIHGYDFGANGQPVDQTGFIAGGWAWASGGIVSTPADLNRFIRAYVGGQLFSADVRAQQLQFVLGGGSEPTGPGTNSAGLGVFRYQTRCGTVFGHTGNIFGYTQFMAASRDGTRSATVSINLQRTQTSTGDGAEVFRSLREAETLAVCAALADD